LTSLQTVRQSARSELASHTRTFWSVHPVGLFDLLLPVQIAALPLRDEARAALFDSREPFIPSLYLGLGALPLVAAGLAPPPRPRARRPLRPPAPPGCARRPRPSRACLRRPHAVLPAAADPALPGEGPLPRRLRLDRPGRPGRRRPAREGAVAQEARGAPPGPRRGARSRPRPGVGDQGARRAPLAPGRRAHSHDARSRSTSGSGRGRARPRRPRRREG